MQKNGPNVKKSPQIFAQFKNNFYLCITKNEHKVPWPSG